MELYNHIYEYILGILQENIVLSYLNYNHVPQVLFVLSMLGAIIFLNAKVKKLEKIQLSDIDDVTSFNRLIDDEIGRLKEAHEKQTQDVHVNDISNNASQEKLFTNAPYSQAIHLARRGYARDEIISLCSLTESEAELILALHTNTKAA